MSKRVLDGASATRSEYPMPRSPFVCLIVTALLLYFVSSAVGESWLVKDGEPRARIVIADDPPRRVRLAAQQLQHYIERITGARLTIGTSPADDGVTVYVGRSAHTDALAVDAAGLKHGAFRMVSGPDHLVLLGQDADYTPNEPWPRKRNEQPRAQARWEQIAGGRWTNPMRTAWRSWHQRGRGDSVGWAFDKGGSLNAVYGFLRTLGVRWYMPGELGTVLPEQSSIALPEFDRTVKPDYPLRFWHGAYFAYADRALMWELRLGMNRGHEVLGAGMHVHGMRHVLGYEKERVLHPEYYTLVGGERDHEHRGTGRACFSSVGLLHNTVRYARAVFDQFDEPAISVWPTDGYKACQCRRCAGKSPSELVWRFVDRVARRVQRTHPDRLVTCGAYAQYRNPPRWIERFSPNVAVFISNVGRPTLDHPERWREYRRFIKRWRGKLAPRRIIRNENNRYSHAGRDHVPFPIIHPHAMARDLRAMKGISLGEWNEQARIKRMVQTESGEQGKVFFRAPGLDHLTIYVNARLLWDADRDLEALLDEYYRRFYGPAAAAMRRAFEFAEATYPRQRRPRPGRIDVQDQLKLVQILHEAREVAGQTVYGRRVQLILDELRPLDELRHAATLDRQRGDVPVNSRTLRMEHGKWDGIRDTFKLDGALDEPFWRVWFHGSVLSDPRREGGYNTPRTRVYQRWYQGHIYFGIVSEHADGSRDVPEFDDDDPAILKHDHVEILLSTDYHSWYRIVVNPNGAVLDMDMAADEGRRRRWDANAEVATRIDEQTWTAEVRIPVVNPDEGAMDPFHNVVGAQPSSHRGRAVAWHFNVGRVCKHEGQRRVLSYAPTGSLDLLDPLSFAELYLR